MKRIEELEEKMQEEDASTTSSERLKTLRFFSSVCVCECMLMLRVSLLICSDLLFDVDLCVTVCFLCVFV